MLKKSPDELFSGYRAEPDLISRRFLVLESDSVVSGEDETRTYECEYCRTENQITNSELTWIAIDLGETST